MADNFKVLDSAGSTVTFRSTDVGLGVECAMSIPANTLGTPMIGQATMATSIAVVIASDQSALTTIISALPNPVTSILATGANAIGTVSALQLGSPWGVNLTQLNGTAVNIGQQVMTASVPVVIASNQSTLTAVVSGTVTAVVPNPTTTVISGTPTVNLTQLSGTTLAIGQGVMTASIPVVIASNQSSLTAVVSGTVTAVVPNPTTAVISGTPTINLTQLNGTTLTIGQGVMTASIPVVIASNQSNLTTVISSLPNPITAIVSGTVTAVVAGDIASGSADSGNPVKLGVVGHTAAPTAVADGQRVNLISDKVGKLIAVGAIRELKATQTSSLTTAAEATIINAINATTYADIYGIILANTGATTSRIDIRYGTGSTIVATFEVPTLDTRGFMLPVDSALAGSLSTANVSWTGQLAATTNMSVTAFYVKNI